MATRYVDPVCGIEITERNIGASLEYEEPLIHFCSMDCRDTFMADPLRFIVDEDEE